MPKVKTKPEMVPPELGLMEVPQAIRVGNIGAKKKPEKIQSIILICKGNGRVAAIIQVKAELEAAITDFPYPILSVAGAQIRRPMPINPQYRPVVKPASKTVEPRFSSMKANHVLIPISAAT